MTRAVNVGTIGHISHGRSLLGASLLAVAAAGLLCKASQPVVMPQRRADLEVGHDLNADLEDAGLLDGRKARKAAFRDRLQAAQRAAAEGRA